ncbi:MAG: two-component system, cell cycle sensor histidine kinase and response regulator CckA [Acidobacteriota bacterium]|nr:two-component system, cell cycle sensor histidine kinase and response regulator CckA [Acidobacteriota bacterium]
MATEELDLAATLARVKDLEEELALARRALRVGEERLRDLAEAQVVGRLAGGVAHSFNNLLTAMAFDTELALSRLPESDPIRKHLVAVQSAVERGGTLVRQLLAFGREREPRPRALDLNRVVAEVGESVRHLLAERIELVLDLTAGLPPVRMDPLQMEQVLLTMAANAWEAMPDGGRLRIATAAARPPETRVQLTVTDTGRGMGEEALAHLFEPLYSTWEEGGLGLGLTWAREVVQQAGGRIDVESCPGEGSTFRIFVPTVEPLGAGTAAARGIEEPPLSAHFGAETILLVEDEGDLRRPLAEILEDRGYLVLSAASGPEAMDLAARHDGPIHLLVTDVVMPGMSGQELARLLTPQRAETRVIFTTGYPEDMVAEETLLGDGPYHFLKKPFSSQALMQLMQEVLRG